MIILIPLSLAFVFTVLPVRKDASVFGLRAVSNELLSLLVPLAISSHYSS